ncbi:YheC/YheD family protein [Actinomycetes bacterium NPDC127524]
MKKTYPAEIVVMKSHTLLYPSQLGNLDKIEQICFGKCRQNAEVKPSPFKRQSIILSESLAESLQFPESTAPLHLFVYGNSIHIGPLVGIFTSGFTTFINKPLGERSQFFSRLLSLNETTGCIPFVFGENQIDWEKERIKGYIFQDNQWSVVEFPFPDVVYDRLPNRKTENKSGPKEVKRKFQEEYMIPWYNPGFFNKWDIYQRLTDDQRAIPYLPETYPFQSLSAIEALLSKYRQVFIKPVHGSLGLGIHQILYDKHSNAYYCRYKNDEKENKLQRFPSLESMFDYVFKNKKVQNLIVQQGISLLRSNNRAIDFRVHTNKDQHGAWQVTAIAAKVGGEGSVTTHVKNGGEIRTVDELFEDPQVSQEVQEKLSYAALVLSNCIEQHLDGIIAEIGFDLGIDKKGRIWMFEANSKPGRSIFSHPKLKEFELLTRKLSLDYAVYLAEQYFTSSAGTRE